MTVQPSQPLKPIAILLAALVLALAGSAALRASTSEAAGIQKWTTEVSSTQAGGHPDVGLHMAFDTRIDHPSACNCGDPRIITTHFPEGFIGNPHALPRCSLAQFGTQTCPPSSQVGAVMIQAPFLFQVPVYNMEPRPDQAGMVAFTIPLVNASAFIDLGARTDSDYGLEATSEPIFHLLPLLTFDMYLWGVPASPVNDVHRWPIPNPPYCTNFAVYPDPCFGPVEAKVPPVPYLQAPTECGRTLSIGLDVEYYDHTTASADSPWPATTGCDQLSFNPSLTAQPTTTAADSASGLDVILTVPQPQSPTLPSPSEIKATTVTMPEGFSINPNAADGKVSCSDLQGAFGTTAAADCPEASKVGTSILDSSALPGPIAGGIFLGEPLPGDKYRLFLTADGFATHVKLAGTVRPDPGSGQLIVSFPNLPQSPFQEFNLHFFGSERGLLATPTKCGVYTVSTEFVPWNDILPTQTALGSFTIDRGPDGHLCPGEQRPFSPQASAGTVDGTAGTHSPFSINLTRPDGNQYLAGLDVKTPAGFSATLSGVPYCPESAIEKLADPARTGVAEIAAPACPAASRVGSATAGVGAGTHPFYTPGSVYLAGPYKGAPLSLEVVIPAVSGPYDLGNVAVRAAVHVDPATAQVSAVSDRFPQILDGIPLRTRSILVNLDRPNFTVNPTDCSPSTVDLTAFGDQGAQAALASHFQVSNCKDLDYAPKLSLRLSGGVKRRGHPAIKATFTAKPGEANTDSVQVALPKGELLDNNHLGTPCTRPQFAADNCQADSLMGTAEATTPLLDRPLKGNVYLRSSPTHKLPDMVLDLEGQIEVELEGKIDTVNGGSLRTTFENVPDAPVTSLTLNLLGGAKGLLQNSRSLCDKPKQATTKMVGQNGLRVSGKTKLQVACGAERRGRHR